MFGDVWFRACEIENCGFGMMEGSRTYASERNMKGETFNSFKL